MEELQLNGADEMKQGQRWCKWEPGPFLDGCIQLNLPQFAVYTIVLNRIYQHDGWTLNHPRSISTQVEGLTERVTKNAIDHLIEIGKLITDGTHLSNEKALKVLGRAAELSEIKSKNARGESGKPNKNNDGDQADAQRTLSLDIEESREDKKKTIQKDFNEWWREYPRKVGKPQAFSAYVRCHKKFGADVIMMGTLRLMDGWQREGRQKKYIPYPATFLNGEQFNDSPDDTSPPDGGRGAQKLYTDLGDGED